MSLIEEKFSARRSNIQVIADILAEAIKGASKTKLVYKANLNFKVMERYLRFLSDRNMIELLTNRGGRDKFITTQRGKEFLYHYSQVEDILKLFDQTSHRI